MPTFVCVWEGREGIGYEGSEGLLSLTGDRDEAPLGTRLSAPTDLQCHCVSHQLVSKHF